LAAGEGRLDGGDHQSGADVNLLDEIASRRKVPRGVN
jgi:hypothetical protein